MLIWGDTYGTVRKSASTDFMIIMEGAQTEEARSMLEPLTFLKVSLIANYLRFSRYIFFLIFKQLVFKLMFVEDGEKLS
jgi:hypothetical protein